MRRHGDRLYVTDAWDEKRLNPGDCLIKVNRRDITSLAKKPVSLLYGLTAERELWEELLKTSWSYTIVKQDGTEMEIAPGKYPVRKPEKQLSFAQISEDVVCLRLDHFTDPEAVESLVRENTAALHQCKKLILDIRRNEQGIDSAFFPLLTFLCQEPTLLKDIVGYKGMYTNYTANNCSRRIEFYSAFLQSEDKNVNTLARELIRELEGKSGKGFLYETDEELVRMDVEIPATTLPQKLVVLTDVFCQNAAEEFAAICKRFPKATVLGRATRGALDYVNFVTLDLDRAFHLTYPISMSADAWQGKGVNRIGIIPDIHVPWTPDHIHRDVDMEKALQL